MILAITRKELLGGGRAAKWYVLRASFLLVLCLVTVPTVFAIAREIAATPGFRSYSRGMAYVLRFGFLELVLVAVLAPAISITAVAGEKASGLLELLHVAGVRPAQVVLGKLASRVSMLALFIVSGVPLLFVGTVLGGAGAELIGLVVAHCIAAAVMGTGLGLLVSSVIQRAIPALVAAYMLSASLYAIPFLLALAADVTGGWVDVHLEDFFLSLSPPIVLWNVARGTHAVGASIAPWVPQVVTWLTVAPPICAGLFFAMLAIPLARPSVERTRAQRFAEKGIEALEATRIRDRGSRAVTGNPVAWREARSHRYGFGVRVIRLAYLALGGALAVHLLAFSVLGGYKDLARAGVALLSLSAAAITLIVASTSIAAEREARALGLLSISRLSPGDILAGKLEGLWLFLWPVIVMPMVPALAFIGLDVWAFVMSALMTFVLVLAALGIGLFFSAFSRRPATAVWASIAASGAWLGLVPFTIATWCRTRCVGEANVIGLLNPIAIVLDLVNGFARSSGERRYMVSLTLVDPWVPYAGMLLLLFVASMAFAGVTWRLAQGGEA